jgi:tetratricopeptide (TPR) repeat protein
MAHRVVSLDCPNCGAPADTGQSTCPYCRQPVIVSTFNSVHAMPLPLVNQYAGAYSSALGDNPDDPILRTAVAMCYLKLKLYDKASQAFERAVEGNFDNAEAFFYAAVASLGGKIPFVAPRAVIDRAVSYLEAANQIEPKGIHFYLLAYIKADFFERKRLNNPPSSGELLAAASRQGLSPFDVDQLWAILGLTRPASL